MSRHHKINNTYVDRLHEHVDKDMLQIGGMSGLSRLYEESQPHRKPGRVGSVVSVLWYIVCPRPKGGGNMLPLIIGP